MKGVRAWVSCGPRLSLRALAIARQRVGFGSIDRGDVRPRESPTRRAWPPKRNPDQSTIFFPTTTCDGATGMAFYRVAHRYEEVHRWADTHRLEGAREGPVLGPPLRLLAPLRPREDPHLGQGRRPSRVQAARARPVQAAAHGPLLEVRRDPAPRADLASRDMLAPACGLDCREPTGRRTGSISAMNGSRAAR